MNFNTAVLKPLVQHGESKPWNLKRALRNCTQFLKRFADF